ncbi:hypothetical protein [Undibacterium luofuense]
MWILLLEAGVAMLILIMIVWWTMFSKKPDQQTGQTKDQQQK